MVVAASVSSLTSCGLESRANLTHRPVHPPDPMCSCVMHKAYSDYLSYVYCVFFHSLVEIYYGVA